MAGKVENKFKFTEDRLKKVRHFGTGRECFYRDISCPGLALRVTDKDAKSYVFEQSFQGKTCRITIGDLAHWDLKQAQARSVEFAHLIDKGIDPRLHKLEVAEAQQAARAERQRQDATLREVWDAYIDDNKSQWGEAWLYKMRHNAQSGGDKKERGKGRKVAGCLASLMSLKLTELTPEVIASWLDIESQKRPIAALQSYRQLVAMNGWAEEREDFRELIPPKAFAAKFVKKKVPKQQASSDYIQRKNLPLWFATVNRLNNHQHRVYLQVLLLTGARRNEIATLQWEGINFNDRTMVIHDKITTRGGKVGERTIPLTPYVETLLKSLRRKNGWVFPGRGVDGPMTSGDQEYRPLMLETEMEYVTLHGLRRTYKTLSHYVGMHPDIAAKIQGHASKGNATVAKHYDMSDLELLGEWANRYEAWLLEQAGITPASGAAPGLRLVA